MADRIRVLLTEEEVDKRINEVAAKISEDYAGTVSYTHLTLPTNREV